MIEKSMSGKAIVADVMTGITAPARGSMACAAHVIALALVSFYLMFAPVWAPLISSRVYDDARYLQLGLLAVMVALLALPRIRDSVLSVWNDLGGRVQALWAVFLVGGIVSAMLSKAPNLAALELGLGIQLAYFTLLICALVRRLGVNADKSLAVAVCAGAALICVQFWMMQAISIFEGRRFSWAHPFLEFANVRFFSQYQSYLLFLLPLPLLVMSLSRKWKAVLYVAAANFWALQWMVGTRAVWIAFAAALIAVCALTRHGRLAFVRTHLLLVVAGAVIFAGYLGATATNRDVTAIPQKLSVVNRGSGSVNERVMLIREALTTIVHRPLTGVGPGQFGLLKYPLRAAHPHNSPLQLLSEYGLVAGGAGIALGMMLVIFAVRSMRSARAGGQDAITVSLGAALIMGLVESLFSGGIIMPHAQMMLCVVAGWLLGRRLTAGDRGTAAERVPQMPLALTMTIVAAALITTLVSFEYWSVVRDMPISAQRWHPHFWQYGRFSNW
jgi:O-antigen ligase